MTIEQMSFVVEVEKYLKVLSVWQVNGNNQGGPSNPNINQGILGDGRGAQRGNGKHS